MSFLVQLPEDQYPADALAGLAAGPFNMSAGRAGAWLAQLAYEDEQDKIERIARTWGLTTRALFKPSVATILPLRRTRGVILQGPGALLIAFAGTDPLVAADWVTDFDFSLGPDGVHFGFGDALAAVWPDITATLTATPRVGPLFIAGHSLGAALAVLCAQRAREDFAITAEAIYAFGMPRIGSPAFAEAFDQALGGMTYRFVHGDDIVATVPPSAFGFRHVGRFLACPSYGKFELQNLQPLGSDVPDFAPALLLSLQNGIIQLLSGSLPPEIRPDIIGQATRLLPPPIADHLPDRYWRAFDAG
jgi:triacylglycerol lipase